MATTGTERDKKQGGQGGQGGQSHGGQGGQGGQGSFGQGHQGGQHGGSSMMDQAKDTARNVGDQAKQTASNVADKARQVASSVGDRAESALSGAGKGMENLAHTIRDRGPQEGMWGQATSGVAGALESGGRYLEEQGFGGMAEDLTGLIRRNPIPAVLIGVGLGFMLARFTTPRNY